MDFDDKTLLASPSDASIFLACRHLTTLDLAVARNDLPRPVVENPQAELIRCRGAEHERAYLAELLARGLDLRQIELANDFGREPAFMHVVLGSGVRDSYRPGDFMAYYRRVRQRFLEFVADPLETYPLPVSHCSI